MAAFVQNRSLHLNDRQGGGGEEEEEEKEEEERSEKKKELLAYFLKPWWFNPFSASRSGTQQLLAASCFSDSGTKRTVTFFERP